MQRVIGRVVCAAMALVVLGAGTAQAQDFGIRAGASGSPDQFYFGVHLDTTPVADRISFRPNVEVGIGDGLTLAAANLEFVFRQPLNSSRWQMLVGGGPAANFYSWDGARGRGDSDIGGGLNLLLGLEHVGGFFSEIKVGLIDSPSVKFGVGFSFGR